MLVVEEHRLAPRERAYLRAVGAGHCRLLERSWALGQLEFLRCELGTCTSEDAERRLVALTLIHVERFRMLVRQRGPMACVNLVLPTDREQLDLAHWYGKLIYTRDAIMFGKFAAGRGEHGEDGASLPVPPFTFLSIRSMQPRRDDRFFPPGDGLRPDFETARARSTSPLAEIPGCAAAADAIGEAITSGSEVQIDTLAERLDLWSALRDWRAAEELRRAA